MLRINSYVCAVILSGMWIETQLLRLASNFKRKAPPRLERSGGRYLYRLARDSRRMSLRFAKLGYRLIVRCAEALGAEVLCQCIGGAYHGTPCHSLVTSTPDHIAYSLYSNVSRYTRGSPSVRTMCCPPHSYPMARKIMSFIDMYSKVSNVHSRVVRMDSLSAFRAATLASKSSNCLSLMLVLIMLSRLSVNGSPIL